MRREGYDGKRSIAHGRAGDRRAARRLGCSPSRAEDLTPPVRDQAKLLLLDTIGCGFAALDEPSACALLAVVEGSGGAPQCTVIGAFARTSASNATLANGALVRILDFNDYVNAKAGDLGGHPSDNIPVALAAGELYCATGREVIAAIVLGYEISAAARNRWSGTRPGTASPCRDWSHQRWPAG